MSQDRLDKKIKDIFGTMDDHDHKEALARKENVWQAIHPSKDKKNSKKTILILLLGALLFLAGWFLRNAYINHFEAPKMEQKDELVPNQVNQQLIAQMKTRLDSQEQQLDSLLEANKILFAELTATNKVNSVSKTPQTKINTIYVKDTVYVTEIKIEQQIVDRIIKDTIRIEVPIIEYAQPTADATNNVDTKNNNTGDQTAELTSPGSIQFNFSESKKNNK